MSLPLKPNDGKTYAIGKGKTKKGAEQIAAYQTILLLKKRRR